MAREGARLVGGLATPTIEIFRGVKHNTTTVGTSATAIPATNLSGRKAIGIQNLHDTNLVYIGGAVPEIIIIPKMAVESKPEGEVKSGVWFKSATGNEWYYASSSGATTGMTQPKSLYSAVIGSAEAVRTEGTVGSLAGEHGWGWGDGDTLGFSTLYVRTGGATYAHKPDAVYSSMISYFAMPDSSSTYGWCLGDHDGITLNLDGSVRLFAISSGAGSPVVTLELC